MQHSELAYFDTTKSFPPDIMHDLLEGVIPLVLRLVLTQAHREKHITIDEVNEELKKMSFGQNDTANKPVLLSENLIRKSGIVGSASQKWCLFRLLPFLIAHSVPPDSKYWHVFLLCQEISDIVMASTVKKQSLPMLDLLVHEFLTEMRDVFGIITPKCHYLILIFSTYVNVWTSSFSLVYEI